MEKVTQIQVEPTFLLALAGVFGYHGRVLDWGHSILSSPFSFIN